MTVSSIAYFRRRAQFHLAMAAAAEQGVAAIHRQLADLYTQRVLKLELRMGHKAGVKRDVTARIPAPSATSTMEMRKRAIPNPTNMSVRR